MLGITSATIRAKSARLEHIPLLAIRKRHAATVTPANVWDHADLRLRPVLVAARHALSLDG